LIGFGDYQTAALGHKQSFVILTVQWLLTAKSGRSGTACELYFTNPNQPLTPGSPVDVGRRVQRLVSYFPLAHKIFDWPLLKNSDWIRE
jgi:hypothetical protein